MGRLLGFILVLFISGSAFAQTCTIVDPDNNINTLTQVFWNPLAAPTCSEVGRTTANSTTLIIPKGVYLIFDNNTDTWTGTLIKADGYIGFSANVKLNTNIEISSGSQLRIADGAKLDIGNAGDDPCPYYLSVASGAILELLGTNPSDRLRFCNTTIAIPAGGSCNPYPAGPVPYCEPVGGFTGPFVFTDAGLPIELLFFKGTKNFNKISLSWATSSELNFDYFDIEKSADGKSFQSIARVSGHGTTNERHDYAMDDEKPYIGKNYYRLKAVDFDGSAEYFSVVLVDFDGSKAFSILPNPSDGITFTAETNFVPETRAYVAIYSTLGSEIGRYEVSGNKSLLTLPVKLESGVYYAKYISADFTSTNRVVVR